MRKVPPAYGMIAGALAGGSVSMNIAERLKLIPYESAIGLAMTIVSTLIFGVFKLF